MKGMRKIRRGKNFARVVQYALKPGVHHKSDPVVIGGNMLSDTAIELIAEFDGSKHLRPEVHNDFCHTGVGKRKLKSLFNRMKRLSAELDKCF